MENNLTYKDQIKISVLVILGFTIAMIGGAYAYFSATVTGSAITNTVQAAILAGIDFEGGQNLVIPDSGIYPGWYGVQSVTINKPDGLTEGVGAYSLTMDPTVDPAYGDWVTYEVYKTTDAGKTITRVEGDVVVSPDGKVSQTDDLTFTGFTETTDAFKKGIINSTTTKFEVDKQNYDMATFETITYIFVYHFTNPDIDQNAAMGKSFSVEIDVEMINQFEEEIIDFAACQADYQTRGLTPTADEHFTYEEVNGALRITAYSDAAPKDVIIPCEINDIPVVFLGETSFSSKMDSSSGEEIVSKGITSVVIPNTVRVIEGNMNADWDGNGTMAGAFLFNSLTEIVIPEGVTEIGDLAFFINQLSEVVIPDSVVSIGTMAFYESQLTNLVLSNNLKTIGDLAFAYGETLTELVIPNSVVSIGREAFSNHNINSLTLGNSVERIEIGAFGSNQLTSVSIPSSVTYLSGFDNNLFTEFTIPSTVEVIGYSAFAYNALTNVIIPDNITAIEAKAFKYNNINSLSIGNNVESIGVQAFGNNKLTIINIPSSVTYLSGFNNNLLTSVNIPSTVDVIGSRFIGDIFGDPPNVGAFQNNETLTSVTIAEGIHTIEDHLFDTTSISTITLPASLRNIGIDNFERIYNQLTVNVKGKTSETDFDSVGDELVARNWNYLGT